MAKLYNNGYIERIVPRANTGNITKTKLQAIRIRKNHFGRQDLFQLTDAGFEDSGVPKRKRLTVKGGAALIHDNTCIDVALSFVRNGFDPDLVFEYPVEKGVRPDFRMIIDNKAYFVEIERFSGIKNASKVVRSLSKYKTDGKTPVLTVFCDTDFFSWKRPIEYDEEDHAMAQRETEAVLKAARNMSDRFYFRHCIDFDNLFEWYRPNGNTVKLF